MWQPRIKTPTSTQFVNLLPSEFTHTDTYRLRRHTERKTETERSEMGDNLFEGLPPPSQQNPQQQEEDKKQRHSTTTSSSSSPVPA